MASQRNLPERTTRGKRLRAALEDEEDEADNAFWQQEFFQEEAEDHDYEAEPEEEDVVDSDFDEPEDDMDDDEEQEVEERPKRKTLKAPEPKAPPKARAPKPASADGEARPAKRVRVQEPGLEGIDPALLLPEYSAPTLRRSTVTRTAEAVRLRQERGERQPRPAKPSKGPEWRPLTQAEMLVEAARTEIDNMHSLKYLMAREEATKKKATLVKHKYTGPLVRLSSRKRAVLGARAGLSQIPGNDSATQGDGSAAQEAFEATCVYELHSMSYPPLWLRRIRAPPPQPPPPCVVTGAPAKYRDPSTGLSFASTAAWRRIKGLPHVRGNPIPAPPPLPTSAAGFSGATTQFTGAPSRAWPSPTANMARAVLPPELPPLPPPSQDTTVHALAPTGPAPALPSALMAVLLDVHQGVV